MLFFSSKITIVLLLLIIKEKVNAGVASWTYYTSYAPCCSDNPNYDPNADTTECTQYSACDYSGDFAAIDHQTFEYVQTHNLVSFYDNSDPNGDHFNTKYANKIIRLTANGITIDAIIADTCGNNDCDGCCSENAQPSGYLVDMEYWTVYNNYGTNPENIVDGQISFTILDTTSTTSIPTNKPTTKSPTTKPTTKSPTTKPTTPFPTKKPTTPSPTTKSPTLITSSTTKSPTSIKTYNYILIDQLYTWNDASLYCKNNYNNGNLASIHSTLDNDKITQLCINSIWYIGQCWIGYNNIQSSNYVWSDSSVIDYVNWYSGEPNNYAGTEHCAYISFYKKWYDYNCAVSRAFICQF